MELQFLSYYSLPPTFLDLAQIWPNGPQPMQALNPPEPDNRCLFLSPLLNISLALSLEVLSSTTSYFSSNRLVCLKHWLVLILNEFLHLVILGLHFYFSTLRLSIRHPLHFLRISVSPFLKALGLPTESLFLMYLFSSLF